MRIWCQLIGAAAPTLPAACGSLSRSTRMLRFLCASGDHGSNGSFGNPSTCSGSGDRSSRGRKDGFGETWWLDALPPINPFQRLTKKSPVRSTRRRASSHQGEAGWSLHTFIYWTLMVSINGILSREKWGSLAKWRVLFLAGWKCLRGRGLCGCCFYLRLWGSEGGRGATG